MPDTEQSIAEIIVKVEPGDAAQAGADFGKRWADAAQEQINQTLQATPGGQGGAGGAAEMVAGIGEQFKGASESADGFADKIKRIGEEAERAKPGEKLKESISTATGAFQQMAEGGGGLERVTETLGGITEKAGAASEALGLVKGGIIGLAVGAGIEAVGKVGSAILETTEKANQYVISMNQFSQATGQTVPNIIRMRDELSKFGVDFPDFEAITRGLAVRASALAGPLSRALEEEGDQTQRAALAVVEARQTRQEAGFGVERAARARDETEAQLDITRDFAPRREQLEAQRSALAVDQAVQGEQSARLNLARAGIRLQYAPELERLADIRGPMTVQRAGESAEEARFQLEEFRGVDPWRRQQIQERRQRLRQQQLEENVTEAEAREREARIGEGERQEIEGRGGGVEDQARMAFRQAQLGERGAQLGVAGAQLSEEQRARTVEAGLGATKQVADASDAAKEAQNAYADAINRVREASLQVSGAERAAGPTGTVAYGQPGTVARQIITGQGGLDLNLVDQQTRGLAINAVAMQDPRIREIARGDPVLAQLLATQRFGEAPGVSQQTLFGAEAAIGIPRTAQTGIAALLQSGDLAQRFRRPLTADEQRETQLVTQGYQPAMETQEFIEQQRRLATVGMLETGGAPQAQAGAREAARLATDGAQLMYGGFQVVTQAAYEAAEALRSIGEAAPQGNRPRRAGGGMIEGPGGPTEDRVPIMASPGEYVVKASRVAEVGVPFLDAINAGRFASGGLVDQAVAAGVSLPRDEMLRMSDEELQTEINRAQVVSAPGRAVGALARGTMEDIGLLNRGLAVLGGSAITAGALVGRGAAGIYRGFMEEATRSAPHEFSLSREQTRRFEAAGVPPSHPPSTGRMPTPQPSLDGGILHDARTTEEILANYRENLDVGIIGRDVTKGGEPPWGTTLPRGVTPTAAMTGTAEQLGWGGGGEDYATSPRFARARAAEHAYQASGRLPPLGDAGGGGGLGWSSPNYTPERVSAEMRVLEGTRRREIGGGYVQAFADGGYVTGYTPSPMTVTGPGAPSTAANHILDLRTDGGSFTTRADEDVINAIRQSAVAAKLTTTGSPTWRT